MKLNWLVVGCSAVLLCLASTQTSAQNPAQQQAAALKKAASQPTPRLPDGHVDLSGVWGNSQGAGFVHKLPDGTIQVLIPTRTDSKDPDPDRTSKEYEVIDAQKRYEAIKNKPSYKAELAEKISYLDLNENTVDPIITCHPTGVPRVGPPKQSFQTSDHIVFFYTGENGSHYRLIPTDGRPHRTDLQLSYMGDSVGHWEGATLVVDATGFNDQTWLGTHGWFHSTAMHVIERYTRQGNILHYEVTVEDPNVFTKPWVQDPRDVVLNTDPNNYVYEELPCVDFDREHLVNHNHF